MAIRRGSLVTINEETAKDNALLRRFIGKGLAWKVKDIRKTATGRLVVVDGIGMHERYFQSIPQKKGKASTPHILAPAS